MIFKYRVLFFCLSSILITQASHSAGFYLKEQSIVSQGSSYAGATARTDSASSVYFNPAGIAGMGRVFEGGAHILLMDQEVSDTGTVNGGGAAPGALAALKHKYTRAT